MFFEPKRVVLRDEKTRTDRRYLEARYAKRDLVFEGRDLGESVAAVFGDSEYEWTLTVERADLPKLRAALGVRSRLMNAIKRRFSGPSGASVQPFMDEHSVPYRFWSRVGD